jgi:hypothetical protein
VCPSIILLRLTNHSKNSDYFLQAKPSLIRIPQLFSNLVIIYLLAYEDGTDCSETSAYKIQTPGNYPEENEQHTLYKAKNKICIIKFIQRINVNYFIYAGDRIV